ncbi:MAG TPA: DUF3658 domain-containing protein [Acetobacteraceae bacterium]|nr:DUF3658 domain-containing protein [Acetobacteraceae bacterium]
MHLHLTLGDHAADLLRVACRQHGLAGVVMAIPEDPSHGPLQDGIERIVYMRTCFRGCLDWTLDVTDAFAPWQALCDRLAREPIDRVLIWHADSVSQYVFLRMACWWLQGFTGSLELIELPPRHGLHAVAVHSPDELVAFVAIRRLLATTERQQLAAEFVAIRDRPEPLRRYENRHLLFVSAGHYDAFLIDACTPEWQPATRVIGAAMDRCDGKNRMSDLFFCTRLQRLINDGRIEASGERRLMQDHQVRRPGGTVQETAHAA